MSCTQVLAHTDPMLLEITQGLNVFQRLALLSQLATVFSGLMFVLVDCVDQQNALEKDGNGRTFLAYIIVFLNAAAAGLYPTYRFFDAWAESGQIDFGFVKDSLSNCLKCVLGTQAAEYLIGSCTCLVKTKETITQAQEIVSSFQETNQEYVDHVREVGSTFAAIYHETKDVKSLVTDVQEAALDVRNQVRNTQLKSEEIEIEEMDISEIELHGVYPLYQTTTAQNERNR